MSATVGYAAPTKGTALVRTEWPTTDPGPHEVRISVDYCGICHSDIHMIDNDWGISQYPFVGGHEVIGTIAAVGSMVDASRIGQRVGVGWQRAACLDCDDCVSGDENLCDANEGTIVGHHGGFASSVIVDGRFAFPIPDALSSAEAGPLLCAGVTVYSALVHAGLRPGMHVGVIGIGGLGHLAVQFARAMGASVTAFTSSLDKAEFAASLGAADHVVLQDGKPTRTPERPFHILLNTVAADLDWISLLKLLGSDGTLSFVGVPARPILVPVGLLLGKRKRIMASPIGGRAILREMLQVAASQGVRPHIEVFPISDVNAALQRVRDNQVRFRAVLRVNDAA